jgi:2-amino-4-hydroxy-6-hydroxymethyldihydropteridine diphosphokinase
MAICFLGLGSNMGNPRKNMVEALKKVGKLKKTQLIKISSLIETDAVNGPPGQRKFLNGCAMIDTTLTPRTLLTGLKHIEKQLGRKKTVRNGPRPIDLDILFYEGKSIKTKTLQIPHPRAFERLFVVKPLRELL